ncbi:hypothetical protein GCM10010910_04840 [Microbacterium nanhaiense]|uniref:AbiEi antitoxin C-terminal domain-containing protein n=1 Tax=Microbacterium nanhaiense TaxID=1301026 RepID=A0ABQ2MWQ2_9MICO|nr:hypothetical protein [Microbacterium nanhaiense]GGO60149.1 hypothetical protein GCM10010910_04840 [Microbacterium nanhaiense]
MAPHAFPGSTALSAAEISAALLDGELRPATRDACASIAMPTNEIVRAESAAGWLPPGHAAVFTTAAWIHGALPREPLTYHAQLVEGAPKRRVWRAGVTIRSWPIPRTDLVVLGGTNVTSLERTFYDLARVHLADPRDEIARALAWFLARAELRERILVWLAAGRRLRYTRMVAAMVHEEVTRYTS